MEMPLNWSPNIGLNFDRWGHRLTKGLSTGPFKPLTDTQQSGTLGWGNNFLLFNMSEVTVQGLQIWLAIH